mmetsp:Transcript_5167/g.18647  ORF Transcript_5167/g.18647 Transcript_5167/m.18647 type:complete len:333 (-) Transcript_5167:1111-2109(-)
MPSRPRHGARPNVSGGLEVAELGLGALRRPEGATLLALALVRGHDADLLDRHNDPHRAQLAPGLRTGPADLGNGRVAVDPGLGEQRLERHEGLAQQHVGPVPVLPEDLDLAVRVVRKGGGKTQRGGREVHLQEAVGDEDLTAPRHLDGRSAAELSYPQVLRRVRVDCILQGVGEAHDNDDLGPVEGKFAVRLEGPHVEEQPKNPLHGALPEPARPGGTLTLLLSHCLLRSLRTRVSQSPSALALSVWLPPVVVLPGLPAHAPEEKKVHVKPRRRAECRGPRNLPPAKEDGGGSLPSLSSHERGARSTRFAEPLLILLNLGATIGVSVGSWKT